jgi:hypothetical protein
LGGKLGEKFHQFTSQGTEKMGESIGEVIGYFIPDLLLVVFSEGISELIEGALKAVRVVLKGSEIGKLALEAVRVADVAVEALAKFVEKADIFLDTKYAELKEELLKIIELIKEWLGIEEEGAEAAKMKKGPGHRNSRMRKLTIGLMVGKIIRGMGLFPSKSPEALVI